MVRGSEFESQSLHMKPEAKLREEREVIQRAKMIASNLVTYDCYSDPAPIPDSFWLQFRLQVIYSKATCPIYCVFSFFST